MVEANTRPAGEGASENPNGKHKSEGPWFVFVRLWIGYSTRFPFERFDCIADEDLPKALEILARDHIEAKGGPDAWCKYNAKVSHERDKARRKRDLGSPMIPGRGRIRPMRVLKRPGAVHKTPFKDALQKSGKEFFDAVAPTAGWIKTAGIVPLGGAYTTQSTYLIEVEDHECAAALVRRLNRKRKEEIVGGIPRFGWADCSAWGLDQWATAEADARELVNSVWIVEATEEYEIVAAAFKRVPGQGAEQEQGSDHHEEPRSDSPAGADLDAIPALDAHDADWVTSSQAAKLEGIATGTLANYRSVGRKHQDGLAGIDESDRVWRKANPNARAQYLKSSLKKDRQNPSA